MPTLTTGAKLGPYEITGAIGAGGMGEVYRARDTRMLKNAEQRPGEISVVLNWTEELKQKTPQGRNGRRSKSMRAEAD